MLEIKTRAPWLVAFMVLAACSSPIESETTTAEMALSRATEVRPTPTTPATAPALTPTPVLPQLPSIEVSDAQVLVFDASAERCAARDIPDLPARAIRDSSGRVVLFAGDIANRRMTGPSLDELTHECEPALRSSYDPEPSHYDFEEWIGAVYTSDGQHVDALVQMEFHGERASDWYAERDFSDRQGERNWFYNQRETDSLSEMSFDAERNRWTGSTEFCHVASRTTHPGVGCDSVRTWISPISGEASISGEVRDLDPYGGDGITVEILYGSQVIWSATIENQGQADIPSDLVVSVAPGDAIHFVVSARETGHNDTTLFNPEINIGPHPCPSKDASRCQMRALTYASSSDGGRTFDQPTVPNHLVAASPYRFDEGSEEWGIWQPSNIIRHPQDGFFYAAVLVEDHELQQPGTCMIRTDNLADPRSWRAWDGHAFRIEFANPYISEVDPLDHICQPVSPDAIGALTHSLTYNDYLGAFILLGHAVHVDTPGFYYALSRDLIHWTPRTLLMEADLVQTSSTPGSYLAYPSLLDPQAPGFNFDVTGQTPYLFFSRFNDASAGDVDLMRVQVTFTQ